MALPNKWKLQVGGNEHEAHLMQREKSGFSIIMNSLLNITAPLFLLLSNLYAVKKACYEINRRVLFSRDVPSPSQ